MSYTKRDWLIVKSLGAEDTDIGLLCSFMRGRRVAARTVRIAIVRILLGHLDGQGMGRKLIALLFEPKLPGGFENQQWTVDFKKTGHANEWRTLRIAAAVQARRDSGKSYELAIEEMVENLDLSKRQVARIYAKHKNSFRRSDL